jgi:hypothetical protein
VITDSEGVYRYSRLTPGTYSPHCGEGRTPERPFRMDGSLSIGVSLGETAEFVAVTGRLVSSDAVSRDIGRSMSGAYGNFHSRTKVRLAFNPRQEIDQGRSTRGLPRSRPVTVMSPSRRRLDPCWRA